MDGNSYEERMKEIFSIENIDFNKAISKFGEMTKAFPEDGADILYELSKMYFRHEYYLKALRGFIMCYNATKNDEILTFVLECYYTPNIDEYQTNMEENKKMLLEYPYYYGEIKEEFDEVKVVWKDETTLIYFYKEGFICRNSCGSLHNQSTQDGRFALLNEISIELILNEISKIPQNYIYLYFDEHVFEAFLQCTRLEKIILVKQLVFIIGKKELQEFFMDLQMQIPEKLFGIQEEEELAADLLWDIANQKNDKVKEMIKKVQRYYSESKDVILKNIKTGKAKILFLTSRNTTALQYHTRDMVWAADKLGIKNYLYIEKSSLHYCTNLDLLYVLDDFKPDLIFVIDHFRFEQQNIIPDEVVYVTWIQDPLPYVMDKLTPWKLTKRDIILSHYTTWEKFKDVGYDPQRVIAAPVPSNPEIYKPYKLTKEELNKYQSDICIVCHAANLDGQIEKIQNYFFKKNDIDSREIIEFIIRKYSKSTYENGGFCYSLEGFKEIISLHSNIFDEKLKLDLANYICIYINPCVFRQTIVDWIIDGGFESIKLWGNDWGNIEKYKKYAMGIAENGEVLSKIYQASKIVVGNNVITTAAARAWETMLSGGFYISNYIPEEYDATDIRQILKEDSEITMFYDKKDLLNIIEYYLTHEEERVKMANIGREKALEKMTFEVLMKKFMKEIKHMI